MKCYDFRADLWEGTLACDSEWNNLCTMHGIFLSVSLVFEWKECEVSLEAHDYIS